MDILGAIPVAPVRVRAWVERPGSRISLLAAEMLAARAGGPDRAVARASAWLLATSDTADVATDRFPPLAEGEADPVPHSWEGAPGYLEAVSWRRQRELDNGSPVVWLSPLAHLVDAEEMTQTQRLALVVDCANGAGAAIDPERFVFMNTDTDGAPAPGPRRQRLRAAGPRLDRARRHRRHHRRDLRPAGVHRDVCADAAGPAPSGAHIGAAAQPWSSGFISCSIVGTSSLTVGWMCMVREIAV